MSEKVQEPKEETNRVQESVAGRLLRLMRSADGLAAASWSLRAARQQFSSVFREAVEGHQPQRIERQRGGGAVVVVDERDYLALLARAPQQPDMLDYFRLLGSDDKPLERAANLPSREIRKL